MTTHLAVSKCHHCGAKADYIVEDFGRLHIYRCPNECQQAVQRSSQSLAAFEWGLHQSPLMAHAFQKDRGT